MVEEEALGVKCEEIDGLGRSNEEDEYDLRELNPSNGMPIYHYSFFLHEIMDVGCWRKKMMFVIPSSDIILGIYGRFGK